MGQPHPSTPAERAQCAAAMLAHPHAYGVVMQLSREYQVSRPTLYAWRDQAQAALLTAFSPPVTTEGSSSSNITPRHVLTLWIPHASVRGIQHAMRCCSVGSAWSASPPSWRRPVSAREPGCRFMCRTAPLPDP